MAALTLYPQDERLEGGSRVAFNLYMVSALALFVLMMLIGLTMRMSQATWLGVPPDFFYKLLSMHGAGMVGTASLATTPFSTSSDSSALVRIASSESE